MEILELRTFGNFKLKNSRSRVKKEFLSRKANGVRNVYEDGDIA
jgi:hypothetical protein